MSIEITDWLRGLGLEQYSQLFRDNDIDGEILAGMNAEDLKELGIRSFGHRRRLLNAITALRRAPPTRDAAQSAMTVTSAAAAPSIIDAERRQLTVMFCDLVGSTPLSTRFDPEDLREIVGAYHRCVADTVARFGGFVAKYMGDGVLIYFGYPEAHEDDAERAARAGLAVIDAVGRLATQEPLNVRIGIATGLVVVGDLIGAGAAQERGVVGETPNLAARLQALARPGTLVVADSSRRQIGTLFEIEDLGPQPLAGFVAPQRGWRVVGESGVVSRFEALRSGTTPLVGREEELDLLMRHWRQAKSGEGRVVLVSGEPNRSSALTNREGQASRSFASGCLTPLGRDRGGGVANNVDHGTWVREHRHMAAFDLYGRGAHAVCGKPLKLGIYRAIRRRDKGPTRLCSPRNAVKLLIEQIEGGREVGRVNDLLLFRGQIAGEARHALATHPDAAIFDRYVIEDIGLGELILLALGRFRLVRAKRCYENERGDAAIISGVRDDGPSIGVPNKNNRTADSPECSDCRVDIAFQRIEGVLRGHHLVPVGLQRRNHLAET